LENTVNARNKEKEEMGSDAKKIMKEFDKYKSNNLNNLKVFFSMITQSDIPEVINVSHEDTEVIKGMMEALKKKKTTKL
jgi:hypothetical protein